MVKLRVESTVAMTLSLNSIGSVLIPETLLPNSLVLDHKVGLAFTSSVNLLETSVVEITL